MKNKTFYETRWKTQRWMNCSVTGPQERDSFWLEDTYYNLGDGSRTSMATWVQWTQGQLESSDLADKS